MLAVAVILFASACGSGAATVPPTADPSTPTEAVSTPSSAGAPDLAPGSALRPRIAVVGDSTAERLAPAIEAWANTSSEMTYAGNASRLGCPIGRGGTMRTAADLVGPVNEDCDWETTAAQGLDGSQRPTFASVATDWDPDLVLVFNGIWDVADRQLPGADEWAHAGEPAYDEWLLEELLAATDELSANGAIVVWLTLAPWEGATRHPPDRLYAPAADPARVVAYNVLLDRLVQLRPDTASVIDLAGWLAETGEDARLRADGAHFEPETAIEVADRFLGAALLAEWRSIGGAS
jgi:hypothetical protein